MTVWGPGSSKKKETNNTEDSLVWRPGKASIKKQYKDYVNTQKNDLGQKLRHYSEIGDEKNYKKTKTEIEVWNNVKNIDDFNIIMSFGGAAGMLNHMRIENIQKRHSIDTAKTKFKNGEPLTLEERLLLGEDGGVNYTNDNIITEIEFLAPDNPENISARNKAFDAFKKKESGLELSASEENAILTFNDRRYLQDSIRRNRAVMTENIKKNSQNVAFFKALSLYNDAAYSDGFKKTKNRIKLYVDTGFDEYFRGTIDAFEIFGGLLTGKELSGAIENNPESAYELASTAIKQYFNKNGMTVEVGVQDIVTNLAENAIPILLAVAGASVGSHAGTKIGTMLGKTNEQINAMSKAMSRAFSNVARGVSMGLSTFGNSYKEGYQLAPEASQGRLFAYATLSTASEVYLDLALTKVAGTSVSGNFTETMIKELSKNVSSLPLQTSIVLFSSGSGELIEEFSQGLLSPVLQKLILGADVATIFSPSSKSHNSREAMAEINGVVKSAAYQGFIGFATGFLMSGPGAISEASTIQEVKTFGAFYKKVFAQTDIEVADVATYLKEISDGKHSELYKKADEVIKGDTSDITVAEMMRLGFEKTEKAKAFVYKKIGECLLEKNPNVANDLIVKYELLESFGYVYPENVETLYKKLIYSNSVLEKQVDDKVKLIGEFAVALDTYIPRAEIINRLTNIVLRNDKSANSQSTAENTSQPTQAERNLNAMISAATGGDVSQNSALQSGANGGIINQNTSGGAENGGEQRLLRNGGQWSGSEGSNTQIPSGTLPQSAGEISGTRKADGVFDGGAET